MDHLDRGIEDTNGYHYRLCMNKWTFPLDDDLKNKNQIDIYIGGMYDSAINLYSTNESRAYYGIYIRGSIS